MYKLYLKVFHKSLVFSPHFWPTKSWICCVISWLALNFIPPWLLWTVHLIQSPLNYLEVFSIHFTRGVKWGFISSAVCTKPFNVHFYGMGCTASYFSLQKCQCWGQKGIKLRNWSLLKISFSGWAKMKLWRNMQESTLAIFSDVTCDLGSCWFAPMDPWGGLGLMEQVFLWN